MAATVDLAGVLTRTKQQAAARAAAARKEYTAFVLQAAEGSTELDPDDVLDRLSSWGREADQFAADVETVARRIELAAVARTAPQLAREIEDLHGQTAALTARSDAEIVRIQQEHAAAFAPLAARATAAKAELRTAEQARDALAAGAGDAAAKLHAANRAVERFAGWIAAAREKVDQATRRAAVAQEELESWRSRHYAHMAGVDYGPQAREKFKSEKARRVALLTEEVAHSPEAVQAARDSLVAIERERGQAAARVAAAEAGCLDVVAGIA